MYPVVGTPFDRVVPKGGDILSGYFVPEGTVVGISGWVTQRDKGVFGDDADSFRPERWLDVDEKRFREMDRSMLAVSTSLSSMRLCRHLRRVVWAGHKGMCG